MTTTNLNPLPLVFSFREMVVGAGFIAGVRMQGRALLETEQADDGTDEVWLTGIAPIGVAGGGADRSVAFMEFRRAWCEVLYDVAMESRSFSEFKSGCTKFLNSQSDELTSLWKAAVMLVRREGYTDPSLRKESADQAVTFEAVELKNVGASENQVERGLQVAA